MTYPDNQSQSVELGKARLFLVHPYPFFFFSSSSSPCHVACGILVPQPGIEPWPLTVKVPSPNHWTAREFPPLLFFFF